MDRRTVGRATVLRGDARSLPLPDNSVDLVVTSPPYFGLRSYQDGGEHYAGQIGDEATPAEFVDALIAATREMVRVVKPSGSIWVNLGDRYSGGNSGDRHSRGRGDGGTGGAVRSLKSDAVQGMRPKSLIGVPWRYALRCIDTRQGVPVHVARMMLNDVERGLMTFAEAHDLINEYDAGGSRAGLGLILRAEVIWSKPNGLPESVTDRVRRSHEHWFHFTVQPRYYSAVDEIREEHSAPTRKPGMNAMGGRNANLPRTGTGDWEGPNQLGKLPGSVWEIPTQPLIVPDHVAHATCCGGRMRPGCEDGLDHHAAFPMEWPRRIVRGWAPTQGVCTECGEGRRPVTHKKPMEWRPSPTIAGRQAPNTARQVMSGTMLSAAETTITGYACACPEPTADTTPGVVLDPFGGTGTTALVAKVLGCDGISVDMSADYCRLAQWRTTDPDQIAAAMQVKKPAKQTEGQVSMFDLFAEEAS